MENGESEVRTIKKLGKELERLTARTVEVSAARRIALLSLVACGWSQRKISDAVGLSQPRVAQILGPQELYRGS